MPITILKADGIEAPLKKKRGRPKGSKDKATRRKPQHNTVQALRRRINGLAKKVDDVTRENDRLVRGFETNPLVLVRDPKGKKLTPEEIKEIANTPTSEVHAGATDELLAVTDRRSRVGRLMLRGVSRIQIAEHLKISSSTLQADVRAVRESWRRNVNQFSIEEAIGESLDFYREVRDVSLREATNPMCKVSDAINAASTALRAEDSKNAFLRTLGLWDLLGDEKRRAFRGESQRVLEQDGSDFSKVVSFMVAAGASQPVDGEFDDVSPVEQ